MKKVTSIVLALTMLLLFALISSCENETYPTENNQISNRTSLFKPGDCPCLPPPDDMIAWWTGDDDATDFFEVFDGTENGVTYASGKVDNAFHFDGSSWIDVVGFSGTGNIGNGQPYTMDLWVYPTQNAQQMWISSPGHTGRWYLEQGSQGSDAVAHWGIGGVHNLGSSAAILTLNDWNHVAVTYDGIWVKLYLNGAMTDEDNIGAQIYNSRDFRIGKWAAPEDSRPLYFTGMMDEIEIFNRALSGSEIQAIYDAGAVGKCKEPVCDFNTETILLKADQDMEVGTVEVTTDAENLYIAYQLNGTYSPEWYFTASHLWVGNDPLDIPKNAAPGQFPYTGTIMGADNDRVEFEPIPLSGIGCRLQEILLATHAKIEKEVVVPDYWDEVWKIGYEETVSSEGWLTNYADEFNWGYTTPAPPPPGPATPTTAGPNLGQEAPPFTSPFIVGTTPISEFPYNSNAKFPYATDFDVQWTGALPYGGMLTVSWSPGQSAGEEKKVYLDGDASPLGVFNATGTHQPNFGWFLDKYPLVEHTASLSALADGPHILNFKHTKGDGTFWDWILLEKPRTETVNESAWGDNGSESFKDHGISKKWGWFISFCDFPE